jgi:hypothetical protein
MNIRKTFRRRHLSAPRWCCCIPNLMREGDNLVELPVTSINYLFDSKENAKANFCGEATFWYLDENDPLKLLQNDSN